MTRLTDDALASDRPIDALKRDLFGASRMRARSTHLRVLLVLLILASVAVPAHASAASRTYIFDGGDLRLVYKPRNWAAGGVGASARMEKIRWTRWGARSAVGIGTAANNNCDPTCAGGSIIREPGRLTWSRPRTCRTKAGQRYRFFTLLRYKSGGDTTTFRFGAIGRDNCRRTSPFT